MRKRQTSQKRARTRRQQKMTKATRKAAEIIDRIAGLEPDSDTMLRFNIKLPYSESPVLREQHWN